MPDGTHGKPGHNTGFVIDPAHNIGGIDGALIMSRIARIEKLEAEKKEIAEAIKDIYTESESSGVPKKQVRQIVQLRKMDPKKRDHADYWLDALRRIVGL